MEGKAWDILTDEEKAALTLSLGHNKSSWQAGEILGKAHYKYLEIQQRALKFIKMFTAYMEESGGGLIPINSDIPWDFKEFILCIIEERKGYRDTLKIIGRESDIAHRNSMVRIKALEDHMSWLANHKDPVHRQLYDLIKEFDRWNNFRVLPESLQEPSAFKRRNKTRLLKHLKNMQTLDPYLIDRLETKFVAKDSYNQKVVYLPLVSDNYTKGYKILKIMAKPDIVKYISKNLKLYMFTTKDEADDYGHLVEGYLNAGKKSCRQGQKFWAEFRETINIAYNYDSVNNIISRRHNLEEAFKSIDKILISKAEKKDIIANTGVKRIKVEKLWNI